MNPPIIVEFAGGLGNQFFQYAFAQYLVSKMNSYNLRPVLFDASSVHRDLKRQLDIAHFDIDHAQFISSRRHLFSLLGCRILTSLSTWEKLIHRVRPYQHPVDASQHTQNFLLVDDDILSKNFLAESDDISAYAAYILSLIETHSQIAVYVRGYWQYNFFFCHNLSHFIFPPTYRGDLSPATADLLHSISENPHSCSIHIRRTDYLESDVQHSLPPLSLEYYQQSVDYISKQVSDVHFYIFSDDPQWCKHSLSLDAKSTIVSGEISSHSIEDLLLMNACAHHILANSSFSWWSASIPKDVKKLTPTPDLSQKITMAPRTWFAESIKNNHIKNKNWTEL